jgi:hypothetical protein
MRSKRVSSEQIASDGAEQLVGAVLLAPIRLGERSLAKGTRIDASLARALQLAARKAELPPLLRLAWGDLGDLHEDDAALRLAAAVAGPGVAIGSPAQSRVDLAAKVDGVLRIRVEALGQLNRIDPLEVFTLFHGQAVRAKQVVASVKVAPHLVPGTIVEAGEAVARSHAPLINVDPYLPLEVAAIAAEALEPSSLERFDRAVRTKVVSLGGRFLGTSSVADEDPESAARRLGDTLRALAFEQRVALILVGGVSAGDPLSPLYAALEALNGRLLRRGVPAHPGSMIWLAALGETTLLGLPQCGMFSMATAADLILPRLLTGERITADTLAELGHGGLLGKEMRFRFPDYVRDSEGSE